MNLSRTDISRIEYDRDRKGEDENPKEGRSATDDLRCG